MENLTRAEFLKKRKKFIGGSDIASVVGVGDWACAKRLFMDKIDIPKDFDDSDRPEFTRGHRLEWVAADYYKEKTGRKINKIGTMTAEGKGFLGVNMDRAVYRDDRPDPGYLEIKVVGRETFWKIKKEGIPDAYITQVQYGLAVSKFLWGSFAVYWPDGDALLFWDFDLDTKLASALIEKAEDFWTLHVYPQIEPEALALGSKPCKTCPYAVTCRKGLISDSSEANDLVIRDDLEAKAKELDEITQERKAIVLVETALKQELIKAIEEKPGLFKMGAVMAEFTAFEQNRFDSTSFKKKQPELYEQFTKKSIVKKFILKGDTNDE